MKMSAQVVIRLSIAVVVGLSPSAAAAEPPFVGRLTATLTHGGQTQTLHYTAGANFLRIERGETDRPHARNLVDRETGAITLLFPHNRSFTRLKSIGAGPTASAQAMPGVPLSADWPASGMPSGIGPRGAGSPPGGPAFPNLAVAGGTPPMPLTPTPQMEKLVLEATGEKTNLLGLACAKYELKQRGERMEIWATDQLLPFQPWLQNQPPRFGPRMIEEQWGELVRVRKLFPLLATLSFENGLERLRFEVTSVTSQKIADPDGNLFRPPADYHEIEPLPF